MELVNQVKDGNRESANQLIRLYYDELYAYVYKLTYDKDQSMDLTQEIFIRALNNIHHYHSKKGSFKSWLYKIAHNYVMNYFNTKEYRNQKLHVELNEIFSSKLNVEEMIIQKEDHISLFNELHQLDSKYKEVIFMKYFQELAIEDISTILDLNHNTVKTRLKRGIEQLKMKFGGDWND